MLRCRNAMSLPSLPRPALACIASVGAAAPRRQPVRRHVPSPTMPPSSQWSCLDSVVWRRRAWQPVARRAAELLGSCLTARPPKLGRAALRPARWWRHRGPGSVQVRREPLCAQRAGTDGENGRASTAYTCGQRTSALLGTELSLREADRGWALDHMCDAELAPCSTACLARLVAGWCNASVQRPVWHSFSSPDESATPDMPAQPDTDHLPAQTRPRTTARPLPLRACPARAAALTQ